MNLAFTFYQTEPNIAIFILIILLICSLFIGYVFHFIINQQIFEIPYVLVITLNSVTAERNIATYIRQHTNRMKLKEKNITPSELEVTYEIWINPLDSSLFVKNLKAFHNITKVILLNCNGDYVI